MIGGCWRNTQMVSCKCSGLGRLFHLLNRWSIAAPVGYGQSSAAHSLRSRWGQWLQVVGVTNTTVYHTGVKCGRRLGPFGFSQCALMDVSNASKAKQKAEINKLTLEESLQTILAPFPKTVQVGKSKRPNINLTHFKSKDGDLLIYSTLYILNIVQCNLSWQKKVPPVFSFDIWLLSTLNILWC